MGGVRSRERGFTLTELLIAMLIASLLLGSMYSVYTSNYKTFRVQEQIAEAQQNARGALQVMSRDIMMAGYSTSTGIIFANRTSLTIKGCTPEKICATNISYSRYSSARIGKREGGAARQAVAERIRRLSFKYKDSFGNQPPIDASGNVIQPDEVKQIIISVTAGTTVFGGYSGSCTLETTITPRNL